MRRFRPSLIACAIGLGVIVVGAVVLLAPWYEATRWQASPEAARAQRNADAPTPIWIPPTPVAGQPTVSVPRPINTETPPISPTATPEPSVGAETVVVANIQAAATPTPTRSDLELGASAFAFLDPPEPGAHARLTLTVHNPTDQPGSGVGLLLPASWLAGYRIDAVDPPLTSGEQTGDMVRLGFSGTPRPGADFDVSVNLTTIDEVIDAPSFTVVDADGRQIGRAHPPTQAPPAKPGPIYSIDIPRLKLHSGVVPVEWEPPLFVVGQVKDSAYVTLGNSVLVGHLRGAAGYNIFDHLDQLSPGDEVIASSRGQTYHFVVSETEVLPEDDTSPTQPSSSPRLTLMTCAGDWNPLTRDYSDRLWIIAEPPSDASEQPRPGPPRPGTAL